MNIIEQNIDRLVEFCLEHKVRELYIFGSLLTDDFNDSSDIDFLVQFGQVDIMDYLREDPGRKKLTLLMG